MPAACWFVIAALRVFVAENDEKTLRGESTSGGARPQFIHAGGWVILLCDELLPRGPKE